MDPLLLEEEPKLNQWEPLLASTCTDPVEAPIAQEEAPTDPVEAYTEYWRDLLAPWKLLSSGNPVEAPTTDSVEAPPEQV